MVDVTPVRLEIHKVMGEETAHPMDTTDCLTCGNCMQKINLLIKSY